MRKLILFILLASAVTAPALADPGEHRGSRAERGDRSNDRADHGDRAERQAARAERQSERQQANVEHPQSSGNYGNFTGGNFNGGSIGANLEAQAQAQQFEARARASANMADVERIRAVRDARQQRDGQHGNWRERQSGGFVQPDNQVPNVFRRDRNRTPVVSDVPRQGTQPRLRTDGRRWTDNHRWDHNWRNDSRYDWQRWRNHNRSRFHLGIYYDPFGWGYQPFSIGWRLWPNYYSSNYWINDPWQYRLPYAPPGTRWIRYYNDALLVDTWSGQVVDVINNFFW